MDEPHHPRRPAVCVAELAALIKIKLAAAPECVWVRACGKSPSPPPIQHVMADTGCHSLVAFALLTDRAPEWQAYASCFELQGVLPCAFV